MRKLKFLNVNSKVLEASFYSVNLRDTSLTSDL